ncbi:unnamed protein product [Cylindrotheca closterium]|uniref:Uncharacterized protein n=1 Tax=Cylindrotheca closterium TaxID=2856 RepID=A0AAD2G9U7_9STRA|nr:unnamed protein product [Cylindrotheca closterium]
MVVWLRTLPICLLFAGSRADQNGNNNPYGSNLNYYASKYGNGDDDGWNDDQYNYDDAYASSGSYNSSTYTGDDTYGAYSSQSYSNLVYSQSGEQVRDAIVENCKRPTISVNTVTILCDSPYTYYYGNGAHRGSTVCDYGDMATVLVNFNVKSKIRTVDKAYMTIAIYAQKSEQELLFAAMNIDMADIVGKKVSNKGNYEFSMRAVLAKAASSDNSQFVPSFQMGFSTMQDEGYNLGGVNINCNYNVRTQPYSSKFYRAKLNSKNKFGAGPSLHFASFGFMIGVALLAGTFLFFYNKKRIAMQKQAERDDDDENADNYVNAKDDPENSIFKQASLLFK